MTIGIPLFILVSCLSFPVESGSMPQDDIMLRMADILKLPATVSAVNLCSATYSCQHRFWCSCDEHCWRTNDCCEDATLSQSQRQSEIVYPYMNCMFLQWEGSSNTFSLGQAVVSKCPNSYTNELVKTKCENPERNSVMDRIPTSSIKTFITYRNIFCAQCHQLQGNELVVWEFLIHCDQFRKQTQNAISSTLESYMVSEYCGYVYKYPDRRSSRACQPEQNYIEDCPPGADVTLRDLCRRFYQPLYLYSENYAISRYYRNRYCLQCDNTQIQSSLFHSLKIKCYKQDLSFTTVHPLLILLNFTAVVYDSSQLRSYSKCKENEIYINPLQTCVTLHCPDGSVARYSKCVKLQIKMNGFSVRSAFYINGSIDQDTAKDTVIEFADQAAMSCGRYWPLTILANINITVKTGLDTKHNKSCMLIVLRQDYKNALTMDTQNHTKCFRETLRQSKHLADDIVLEYSDDVSITSCIVGDDFQNPQSLIWTPVTEAMNTPRLCPSIQVNRTEPNQHDTSKLNNNAENDTTDRTDSNLQSENNKTDRYTNVTGDTYRIGSLIIDSEYVKSSNTGFFICLSDFNSLYESITDVSPQNDIFTVITYVSLWLSISCLMTTICHYLIVPKLLTNQSVILLHLVIIMAITHAVYMVGLNLTPNTNACWWISVFLHFLFLSLFASMSLTLINITRQVRNIRNPCMKKKITYRLLKYAGSAYILSFCIVFTTVLTKKFIYPNETWYGNESCFITNPFVLLFSFAVPVGVSLICNACIFLFLIPFIFSQTISMSAAMNRRNLLVALKLSMLVGITWVLGFVAVLTRNDVVLVLYEVTTALHGVFLSVSLLANQTVHNWYKKICLCRCGPTETHHTTKSPVSRSLNEPSIEMVERISGQ